jgi:hypothetical protein
MRADEGTDAMTTDEADAVLATRLAPRLRLLHGRNGDDWAATARGLVAALRETHALAPHGNGAESEGAGTTPDTPREDD